jgi:hypothetical protein
VTNYETLLEEFGNHTFGGEVFSGFPYNYNNFTSNKAPSSEFKTCSQCDPRCNDCEDYVPEPPLVIQPVASEIPLVDECPDGVVQTLDEDGVVNATLDEDGEDIICCVVGELNETTGEEIECPVFEKVEMLY